MKVRDVIKRLEEDGWVLVRDNGSHKIFKKQGEIFDVVVPGHGRDDLAPGTLSDIRQKSGLPLR
jgi:predicted RNA binding protein YcfA (HicA-like mRNA interferase family)